MRRVFRLPLDKSALARELDDELAFHLETRIQRLIATGMSPEAARSGSTAPSGTWWRSGRMNSVSAPR